MQIRKFKIQNQTFTDICSGLNIFMARELLGTVHRNIYYQFFPEEVGEISRSKYQRQVEAERWVLLFLISKIHFSQNQKVEQNTSFFLHA
jgi:hypothetical protein